jgi:aspartate carbamoyltransferase regulatory subunit
MIYNIIAICRNETCEANGVESRFEIEDPSNAKIVCGPCQVVITDVTVSEA